MCYVVFRRLLHIVRRLEASYKRATATTRARAACTGGASQAFRWVKEGQVDAAPVPNKDGNPSVLVGDQLDAYTDKYSRRWVAFDKPIDTVVWDEDETPIDSIPLLPPLTPAEIHSASKSFKVGTSQVCGNASETYVVNL